MPGAEVTLRTVTPDTDEIALLETVEQQVFGETFGESAELLEAEYAPYRSGSCGLVALSGATPVGAMRLLAGDERRSKTLTDAPAMTGDTVGTLQARLGARRPARVVDVATLAVVRDHRGPSRGVTAALVASTIAALETAAVEQLVTILDAPVFDLLNRTLNAPFVVWPGTTPAPYLGSPSSVLAVCDLPAWQDRNRRTAPRVYELLTAPHRQRQLGTVSLPDPDDLAKAIASWWTDAVPAAHRDPAA